MNEEILPQGFPGSSAGKESACSAGGSSSILGLERSPGEGISYPLQYSGWENSMDSIFYGVAKNQTQLRDFHFLKLYRKITERYRYHSLTADSNIGFQKLCHNCFGKGMLLQLLSPEWILYRTCFLMQFCIAIF